MIKHLQIAVWLCCISFLSFSQPYGNEWIDHDKTYYKFKLDETGLYRIPYSTLLNYFDASELVGTDLRIHGRGEQTPIYVSTDGVFGAGDYIEFYGRHNDGELDAELFKDEEHVHRYYSMYNDEAAYFITLNPGGQNFRLTPTTVDPAGLSVEPYFWHKSVAFYTGEWNSGQPIAGGSLQVLRDSHYGKGEGYTGGSFNGPATRNRTLETPNVYRVDNSLIAKLEHVHVTKSYQILHNSVITVGSSSFSYPFFGYDVRYINEEIPLSDVTTGNTTVSYRENNSATVADALAAIEYPRSFSFSNQSLFYFLVENRDPLQLQITSFNAQSTTPILYDVANGRRYEPTVNGSRYDFGLDAVAGERRLVMVSQSSSNFTSIEEMDSVRFVDYTRPENQGDYFILSNRRLMQSSEGVDNVTEYSEYRSRPEGGEYISQVAWIEDIEDQFGWGVRNHPLAIRNFINYGIDNFNEDLSHLFIIGKGITYTSIRNSASNFNKCLVVSMGNPDSDVYMTARSPEDEIPQIAVGRLSASNGDDVGLYLGKMMEYEGAQIDTSAFSQTIEGKQWMKRLLHLGGGKNAVEQAQFRIFLNIYKMRVEGPKFGGKVHSVFKTSTDPIQISTSELVDSLIDNGISLITFFGHSSTSTIDFDITPEEFENYGKYHVFLSNGCFVGSIFGTSTTTYSDRFIFQENTGSIAYIAPITLAVPSSLNYYSSGFYDRFSNTMYRSSIGEIMRDVSEELINTYGSLEDLLAKQMILHGDPAIKINLSGRPDYIINQNSISYIPNIVSAARDSFDVQIAITNVGKAINQDYIVNIQRALPGGGLQDYQKVVPAANFRDTVIITLPTDRVNGLGVNIMRIKVDYGEEISEMSEFNNEVVDTLVIFSDDIRPIFPYDFCIQNSQPETIYFSTASYGNEPKQYKLQIDTTENFNSPILQSSNITSVGGIVEWQPSVPYLENTVYYVRSALDSLIGGNLNWNGTSFLYNTQLSTGWNQSHFFQFKKDDFFTLKLEEPDRRWEFSDEIRTLDLYNGVHQNPVMGQDQETYLDGNLLIRNSLSKASLNFFVFDVHTGKYLESRPDPDNIFDPCEIGTYSSVHPCAFSDPRPVINYLTQFLFWRYNIIQFIENDIPDDAIILMFTTQQAGNAYNLFLEPWADDAINFPEFFPTGDLYDVIENNLNSASIRDLQNQRPYFLFTQKGNPDFPTMEYHADRFEIVDTTFTFEGNWNSGALRSVTIGPSNGWNTFKMEWNSVDDPDRDEVHFNITGIDTANRRDVLYEEVTDTSFSLSSVDYEQYPHLQLEWVAEDDSNRTAPQLNHWRVLYDKVPEAAVDPQLRYSSSADTIDIGFSVDLELGATNISDLDMDSLLVKISLNRTGSNPVSFYKRYGPLAARQSLILPIELTDEVVTGTGQYVILVELNPDNDQPEQFHFNNYATFILYVNEDRINPLMDVTFDGEHILDGDIISPRPEIIVKLKDENTGLALSDTSSMEMYIYHPDDPEIAVFVDPSADNVTFVPAEESELAERNEAYLYYYPNFEMDGIYRLKVQGKDARNNAAGDYDYQVSFEVINESSISHFLNYPNPFSTSTKFVFTLTGADIPEDIKIQILTVSGSVVREITADELGPIKVGRNITDFAWDGTDRYGDPLANGLYIYKVIARLNGESIKQYTTAADKYFGKEGFGKMYIVR